MLHQTVAKRFVERRKSSFVPADPQMTIVVLGASKVGKSTMVSQFLWQGFDEAYRPTIEEFHWIEYDRGDGHLFTLQIIDSSGSHDFLAMRPLYCRTGDAFVIVFDVDNEDSYEEAKEMASQVVEVREARPPVVLVANQTGHGRQTEEAELFCARLGIGFARITATRQEQVTDVFKSLMDQLRMPQLSQLKKRRQSMPTSSRRPSIDAGQEPKRSCVVS